MSGPLLFITALIYVAVAAGYAMSEERPGMALAFIGYAVANFGFIWDLTK